MSLFTLHVIWPFLWIWATLYRPDRGWGMQGPEHGVVQLRGESPDWKNSWLSLNPPLPGINYGFTDYSDLCGFRMGDFKIFNIPANKWTIPTAVLGGIFIVSGLILLMNYNHPYTFKAQKAVVSIPVVPGSPAW